MMGSTATEVPAAPNTDNDKQLKFGAHSGTEMAEGMGSSPR
jgi:hypothetical protein